MCSPPNKDSLDVNFTGCSPTEGCSRCFSDKTKMKTLGTTLGKKKEKNI